MTAVPLARPEDTAPRVSSKLAVVVPLGIAQTLAWASSYYLLAILAEPIARDTHVASTAVFAAFSAALLISAAIGPHVGRTIDRFGGRLVLMLSNVCFAVGLALLAASESWPLLCLAWFFIGIGMGMGLYDAAFAALARPPVRHCRAVSHYCHHAYGWLRKHGRVAAHRLGLG
jgi:MFS family permease